ncbi:septal ring lytic transglycosylase RlpA family protein [Myxococcota bacterium]|nr:septal ring lytic transglycosylase RlpA family protein [Myxococcota bacterium]MBU1380174.1 septal ring lytic transglycosylase RlpA family protein [Myxococcota bacterium]MBU1497324.1 septal ring lytic transglycosylase RlpA family protein [Myxococcota bacterium]
MIFGIILIIFTGCATTTEYGKASWYGKHGEKTASGERVNPNALTAAHRTLPFNSIVRVTNIKTGKSVVVRITDRGPFIRGRIIDLTKAAFRRIASLRQGVVKVRMDVVKVGKKQTKRKKRR